MGRIFIIIGLIIFLIGLIIELVPNRYWYWFGRLPGDIRIEKENMKIYFPWVTMLIISIVISIIFSIIKKLRG